MLSSSDTLRLCILYHVVIPRDPSVQTDRRLKTRFLQCLVGHPTQLSWRFLWCTRLFRDCFHRAELIRGWTRRCVITPTHVAGKPKRMQRCDRAKLRSGLVTRPLVALRLASAFSVDSCDAADGLSPTTTQRKNGLIILVDVRRANPFIVRPRCELTSAPRRLTEDSKSCLN